MRNKLFSTLIYILAVLICISPNSVFAADVWSAPTYTEQWSAPAATEQWSAPAVTEPWSSPSSTEQWSADPGFKLPDAPVPAVPDSSPSIYIRLQLGSKNARLQDKDIQIEVAPSFIGGSTMVPLDFLADSLKAAIALDQQTQRVTISLKDKRVVFTLGQYTALVNGTQVQLNSPLIVKDGKLLAPLRFVIENLGLFLNYINETQTIEISDKPFIKADASTAEPAKTAESEMAFMDFTELYGTWYIWTPGTATNLYDKTTGNYVTHEYTTGADQGSVIINKDGTYSMTHAAWKKGVTAQGKWRLAFPAEINGERIPAIVLLNGLTGIDWAVAPSANGKIRLLSSSSMQWADGSTSWIFDSELYRK